MKNNKISCVGRFITRNDYDRNIDFKNIKNAINKFKVNILNS